MGGKGKFGPLSMNDCTRNLMPIGSASNSLIFGRLLNVRVALKNVQAPFSCIFRTMLRRVLRGKNGKTQPNRNASDRSFITVSLPSIMAS